MVTLIDRTFLISPFVRVWQEQEKKHAVHILYMKNSKEGFTPNVVDFTGCNVTGFSWEELEAQAYLFIYLIFISPTWQQGSLWAVYITLTKK